MTDAYSFLPDEDPEDFEDENTSTSLSVTTTGRSPLAVRAMEDMAALERENRRMGRDFATSVGKGYDAYARILREQRVGPSKMERLAGALTAFAQPTKSGRIGEALANSAAAATAGMTEARTAKEARDANLAKLMFQRDTTMAELAQKYGLQGMKFRADAIKAGMKGPPQLQPSVVSPLGTAQNPFTGEPLAPGTAVTKTGQIVRLQDLVEKYGADGAESMLAAPPPGGGGAGPAVPPGPGGAPAQRKLGEQWRGEDGDLYQQTAKGPEKIGGPTADYEAGKAAKVTGATETAKTDVATRVELEKTAREIQPLVSVLNEAASLIKSGDVVTGAGANQRLVALKVAALAGDEDAKRKVVASEKFKNATSRQLATIIKQFGSGTAISDSDRAMAEKIAGSDLTLDQASLDWIISTAQRLNDITMKNAVSPEAARGERDRRRQPADNDPLGLRKR